MARQNQKNIKKSQEDKVVKSTKSGVSKLKKSPPKKNKVVQEKVTDEHTITELGQKVKVLNDILVSKIEPTQIIAEFECTENDNISRSEFDEWSLELINLLKKFR